MHTNTILNNLTRIISRHEFSSIENHFQGPKLRSADRWSQFIALAICQIMGLNSLRSLCDALKNKAGKLYHVNAKTIADLYKERWQIELFFKWIKQNLKIKSFLGTTPNAVLSQIWVALCVYLLLAYLKFKSKTSKSLRNILEWHSYSLFNSDNPQDFLEGRTPQPIESKQLSLC